MENLIKSVITIEAVINAPIEKNGTIGLNQFILYNGTMLQMIGTHQMLKTI